MKDLQNIQLLKNISALLENARKKVVVAVNQTIVLTYFEIGRIIVEDDQGGENRAEYGKNLLKDLSVHLTEKFGRGLSETNLRQMRNFSQFLFRTNSADTFCCFTKSNSQTVSVKSEIGQTKTKP